MSINPEEAIEIRKNVYWLGWPDNDAGFSNNPYLILEDDDAILIDPGSRAARHWNWVKKKIESIIPLEKISIIIVNHQDPDLVACIPLIEEIVGVNNFDLIATDRTSLFLPYYGIESKILHVDDGDKIQIGSSGRILEVITSPYLHFPGAMVIYDHKEKLLFSSDIFGGFSVDWSLYANEYYLESMKAFAQPYFPDKRHVNNFLDKIDRFDIDMICPQHGSLIQGDLINKAKKTLRDLDVGIWR
ncbi:MAG: MBL fold metallo-hydrolase [Candidatus Heimdallarchaeota archaeon]|nr:MBL fold metallo-hydrolase [Candidatus Heimdallarchaeota archaeon]